MGTRNERIAEQMMHELAGIIRTDLRDPRVKLVTITGIEVTNDLSYAKVFFSLMGSSSTLAADQAETTAGLQRSAGFLRTQIASRLTIRTVPRLSFHYDNTTERGNHLSQLIDQANASKAVDDEQTKSDVPSKPLSDDGLKT